MKIDNQDIIRTAQQLRDEENEQLDIRPWNRHRSHFRIPSWLVAIPAAVFIGFILGIWTKSSNQSEVPLTAHVDTVYIKVSDPQPQQDSLPQVIPAVQTSDVSKPAPKRSTFNVQHSTVTGRSVANDHIRYDLLVKN